MFAQLARDVTHCITNVNNVKIFMENLWKVDFRSQTTKVDVILRFNC